MLDTFSDSNPVTRTFFNCTLSLAVKYVSTEIPADKHRQLLIKTDNENTVKQDGNVREFLYQVNNTNVHSNRTVGSLLTGFHDELPRLNKCVKRFVLNHYTEH